MLKLVSIYNVLERGNFTTDPIYNLEETNIMTVEQILNVIAVTGQKQIRQWFCRKGSIDNNVCFYKCSWEYHSSSFIFPRTSFHDSMVIGVPAGSIGFANSHTSGWMTGAFVSESSDIKKFARGTKENKIIILLVNHESHCNIDAILQEETEFPSHCTH